MPVQVSALFWKVMATSNCAPGGLMVPYQAPSILESCAKAVTTSRLASTAAKSVRIIGFSLSNEILPLIGRAGNSNVIGLVLEIEFLQVLIAVPALVSRRFK
jgi:hypothetical protein